MTIDISSDEALVLFDWLTQWDKTGTFAVPGEAEQRVLWNLIAELEKQLAEPFAAEYPALLEAARARLIVCDE